MATFLIIWKLYVLACWFIMGLGALLLLYTEPSNAGQLMARHRLQTVPLWMTLAIIAVSPLVVIWKNFWLALFITGVCLYAFM